MNIVSDPNGLETLVTQILTPRRNEQPSSLNSIWTERGTVEMDLGDIAYWSAGTGSPVLLVHGWEGTHADLEPIAVALVENGRQAVALDLSAHGESPGSSASPYDFARGVRAVGERFAPLEAIIAHSLGAPAAAMALLDGLVSTRAVLIAPPQNYERFVRWTASAAGVDPDELVRAFAARGVDVTALDLPRQAAEQRIPALVVHSKDDRIAQFSGGQAAAAAWPGSTFRPLSGLGHRRILRDPETIAAIVEFVTGSRLASVAGND